MDRDIEITPQLRNQVADQCRAVAHMAEALAELHIVLAPLVAAGHSDGILYIQGERSASIMEQLGDMLNGMDAVDDKADGWIFPIMERANRIFASALAQSPPSEGERDRALEEAAVVAEGQFASHEVPTASFAGQAIAAAIREMKHG